MRYYRLLVTLILGWVPAAASQPAPAKTEPKPIAMITEQANGTTHLAFSPNGKLLAAANGKDGTIRFWNVPSGKPLKQILTHPSKAMNDTKIVFSPNGKLLASMRLGYDTGTRLWDWENEREVAKIPDTAWVGDIAFLSDDKLIVLDARHVILFDVGKKEIAKKIPYRDGAYYSFLTLAPDGKRAAVNGLGFSRYRIFDLVEAKEEKLVKTEPGYATALYWTKDAKTLITFGIGQRITFRDVASGESRKQLGQPPMSAGGRLPTMTVTPDEALLAVGSPVGNGGMEVVLWDVKSGNHRIFANHEMPAFSADGQLLAVVAYVKDRTEILVWETATLAKTVK